MQKQKYEEPSAENLKGQLGLTVFEDIIFDYKSLQSCNLCNTSSAAGAGFKCRKQKLKLCAVAAPKAVLVLLRLAPTLNTRQFVLLFQLLLRQTLH